MKQSTSKLLDTIALYVFTLAIAGVGVLLLVKGSST